MQNMKKLYILENPYHGKLKYAKIFAKILKTKFLFKENWKCVNSL